MWTAPIQLYAVLVRIAIFVDGKVFIWGDKLSFQDMDGHKLLLIRQRLLSRGPTYELEKDGEVIAVVKKHRVLVPFKVDDDLFDQVAHLVPLLRVVGSRAFRLPRTDPDGRNKKGVPFDGTPLICWLRGGAGVVWS